MAEDRRGAELSLALPMRGVAVTFAVAVALLNAANAVAIGALDELVYFRLDSEANPSTWFSSVLWLVAAALLAGRAVRATAQRAGWWGATAFAAALSMDETASMHERLSFLPGADLLPFGWVIPAGVIGAAVAAVLAPWFRSLDGRLQGGLAIALVTTVIGAVGIETVAGFYVEDHGRDRAYLVLATVEENLELAGAALAITTLARAGREPVSP